MDDDTCDRCGASICRLEDAFVAWEPLQFRSSLVCWNCLTVKESAVIKTGVIAFPDAIVCVGESHDA